MIEIGLFPLGLVLLPGERLPLHIFEPRYKELVAECLELQREFGLLLEDEAGTRSVGTTALVTEVLDRFDDGRMNIVVEGRERFRLLHETRGRPFRTAQVVPLDNSAGVPAPEEYEACLAAYRLLADAADAEADAPEGSTVSLSYWIAARVDFGNAAKQELLELHSERERTSRLTTLLEQARSALRFSQIARERAATNGRVEPP